MAPVCVGKGTQLSAVNESFETLLDVFKINRPAPGRIADIICLCSGFLWIGAECADHIHPVQGMQMIKMHNMVMLELGTHQQVSNDQCIFRNLDANRIIDCPHRGQSMGVRSDATRTLHKMVGVPGVASL